MATTVDFIEYVCEQIAGTGHVRYRKMFGEYMVYVNDKPILLVCDNTVFVKMLPCLDEVMQSADRGFPYKGAKEHYVLDIDNADFSRHVVTVMEPHVAVPKPRRRAAKGSQ